MSGLACLLLFAFVAALPGCRTDPAERTLANGRLASSALGHGLTLHSYPTTRARTSTSAPARLHANGASIQLCLANEEKVAQTITLELANLPQGTELACAAVQEREEMQAVLAPSLPEPSTGEFEVGTAQLPADPRCQPAGQLSPGEKPGWLRWQVPVPAGQACPAGASSVEGVTFFAGGIDAGEVAFAVAGDLQGDRALAERIGAEVERRGLSFLILLGNLSSGADPAVEIGQMADVLARLSVPVYATVGFEDVSGGGDATFRERFGPTDADFVHRQVRFVLLDSADATLAPAQHDWLTGILGQDARMTLVFTHTPPFDPAGLRDRGFASHREAARFVALLARRGVQALFAGSIPSYIETSCAGIPTYLTGATGAEALDGVGPHFLEVRLDSRFPDRPLQVERVDLP